MSTVAPGYRMLSVRLTDAESEALEAVAAADGVSKSAMVRDALAAQLFMWQLDDPVARALAAASTPDEVERLLATEAERTRALAERATEHLEILEAGLAFVREKRAEAAMTVRKRVAGSLRASTEQRRMQLDTQ
jgi:hypothetical protein